ncbi:MAG: ABC transporter substrate-binding protein [Candidatus Bipolaricaulis sp.]|nr:ABC transporter substrate-binding protein [Candidatus Bipolaricaulis sp.]
MLRRMMWVGLAALVVFGMATIAQEPVTIEFWHAMSSGHQPNLQKLVDDFVAEYPYITVTLVYQGGYGTLQGKVDAAVVAGNLPAIAQVYENWVTPIESILYPIGNFMTDEEKADILDGLVASNTYNGVLTTVPFNKSIMVLYYNKSLVTTPPTTWAEFYEMAKALTVDLDGDGKIDRYGTAFRPAANPEQFLIFLEQAGGSILNGDWTEVTLNNDAGQAAAQFVGSLIPYSYVTSEYMSDHIKDAAMFVDTSAGIGYNVKAATNAGFELGVATLPAGPANYNSMIQGTNLAVFDTPNLTQAQKDAAVLLARFLLRAENTVFWAEKSGYQPVTKSAYNTEEWLDYVSSHDYQIPMSEQMLNAFAQILHPNYGDMRNVLSTGFEEIMRSVVSPLEGLESMAAEIEALLE